MIVDKALFSDGELGHIAALGVVPVWNEPFTGMQFMWVPGGCYEMGCGGLTSECDDDEKPVHKVCVDGFWMSKTEVTQGHWKVVMGNNPSWFKKGDSYPVENVSWHDAKEFIQELNSRSDGATFRLPTEGEWEYACRSAGKAEEYSGGANVGKAAWHAGNSGGSTHPAAIKGFNVLGLSDMLGNVREWCEDWYASDAYSDHTRENPIVVDSGSSYRVSRGGGWGNVPSYVRCTDRDRNSSDYRSDNLGFRLVRTD